MSSAVDFIYRKQPILLVKKKKLFVAKHPNLD